MKTIYLDYAAATPMDRKVVAAMQPYFSQKFHNPSSIYLAGRAANRALEDARGSIAQNLGAKPAEIIFTAGATEANNLAIQGVMKDFPECEVLVSTIEHESVLAPAAIFNYHMVPVDSKGRVDLQKLETMVSDKTVLVSIGLVNNEIGTVQAMPDISKILNKHCKDVYLKRMDDESHMLELTFLVDMPSFSHLESLTHDLHSLDSSLKVTYFGSQV